MLNYQKVIPVAIVNDNMVSKKPIIRPQPTSDRTPHPAMVVGTWLW
jgi:hypothetical protein